MVDPRSARLWGYRALFAGFAAAILFFRLLPLSSGPRPWPLPAPVAGLLPDWLYPDGWPGADLLLCLALVWVQRRPDHLPAAAIAAVFLMEDILTMRPPGLWALLALIGTEVLRSRQAITRDLPFWAEWAMVAAVLAAMVLANRLILAVLMVPQAPLGQVLVHALGTLLLYPLVAVFVQYVLGLHRAAPGEVDSWGTRI
jgi:rod shape-determining protein MreD